MMTATRQRNAVSEGMALGLVMRGVVLVPHERWRVDLSFIGAWRGWEYRDHFPQVGTDLRQGLNGSIAMTRSSERTQTWALYWEAERELTVIARQPDWDPNDQDDVQYALSVIDGDVPLDGWIALASAFLERMAPVEPS